MDANFSVTFSLSASVCLPVWPPCYEARASKEQHVNANNHVNEPGSEPLEAQMTSPG
jgi:hypothetical protein